MTLTETLAMVLYHGYEGTDGWTGFPNDGTYLIFGVILFPIYTMIIAWFTGTPRDTKTGLLGVSYLVGIATTMWVSMLIMTLLIGAIFYGGLPGT
ncbi:hypothetical protein GS429_20065 [Natronorubrum sp. JWXQ-INN-674]|uniref:Uncharacterized protein n=1 Tax=Natronorubrum halalkaliphilum TaxID=2691917 RepID=A0A6B0VRP4_9EURY|nr:hypothetical protein [Natronorubrum halalkaliphilum]MXV64320.1 hypothetical protein [Natronorubrum halalkaliphilum]